MLRFDELTGEHNNKETLFKFFVLWVYIFKPGVIGLKYSIPSLLKLQTQ